jgi:hypothetical protein
MTSFHKFNSFNTLVYSVISCEFTVFCSDEKSNHFHENRNNVQKTKPKLREKTYNFVYFSFDFSGEIARENRDEKLAHGQDAFVSDAECWEAGWYGVNTNWWDELKTYDNKDEVFILLFGIGTGQEGVYSLQRISEEGLPLDTVLAFATQRDADK